MNEGIEFPEDAVSVSDAAGDEQVVEVENEKDPSEAASQPGAPEELEEDRKRLQCVEAVRLLMICDIHDAIIYIRVLYL